MTNLLNQKFTQMQSAQLNRLCSKALYFSHIKNEIVHFYIGNTVVHVDNRPLPDWPVLMDTPAFRAYCEATVRADEAERLAERED